MPVIKTKAEIKTEKGKVQANLATFFPKLCSTPPVRPPPEEQETVGDPSTTVAESTAPSQGTFAKAVTKARWLAEPPKAEDTKASQAEVQQPALKRLKSSAELGAGDETQPKPHVPTKENIAAHNREQGFLCSTFSGRSPSRQSLGT